MDQEPAETQIEYRMDRIVAELDELCRIAANGETQDMIQRHAATSILRRSLLLVNLLKSHDQPVFKRHAA